jgi:hypothetical protein
MAVAMPPRPSRLYFRKFVAGLKLSPDADQRLLPLTHGTSALVLRDILAEPMRIPLAIVLTAVCVLPAAAQNRIPPNPIPKTAVKPDPTHATFILPQDLKWKKEFSSSGPRDR